jgi:iron complex transport system ATP-binding protein
MTDTAPDILILDSLEIGFFSGKNQKPLLPPLNAKASKGEMIAILGRNGVGKSTLLRTMIGLQPKIDGNVFIGGREVSEFSRQEMAVMTGFISTQGIWASNMTVTDLVSLGRFPHTGWLGRMDEHDLKVVDSGIQKVGIIHLRNRYISELSDGERQRTMIARVLAQETSIMIMDEPTAFLDISAKFEIIHLLSGLAGEGRTILFSTHDFGIALSHADKIWLISDEGITQGTPEELLASKSFNSLFNPELARGKRDAHYLKYFL